MISPSISMCGVFCISSRSLNVPGSDSSALQTRYFSIDAVRQERDLLAHLEARAAAPAQVGGFQFAQRPPRGSSPAPCAATRIRRGVRRPRACSARARRCGRTGSSSAAPRGPRRPCAPAACPSSTGRPARTSSSSAGTSSISSGPTYTPSTDAIGAMSHAPEALERAHVERRIVAGGVAHRRVQLVGAAQRAGDVRADVDRMALRRARSRACRRSVATASSEAGVTPITHATCSIASGEHQPCTRCAASSAGRAAERGSGYRAMCASISSRSSSGTGVVAGSGIVAGSLSRSAGTSQPREPAAALIGRSLRGSDRASPWWRSCRRCSCRGSCAPAPAG